MAEILYCRDRIRADHVWDFGSPIGCVYHLYVKGDEYYFTYPGSCPLEEVLWLGEYPTKESAILELWKVIISDFIDELDPETESIPGTDYNLLRLVQELRK